MAPTSIAPLLEANGVARSEDEIVALIRGVLAAPEAVDGDAWLDLIAPADASDLRAALRALKDELATPAAPEPPGRRTVWPGCARYSPSGVWDGMILPLTDEHRSEYIPAASQRLAWLTGSPALPASSRCCRTAPRCSSTAATRSRPKSSSIRPCSSAATSPSDRRPAGSATICAPASAWASTPGCTSRPRSSATAVPATKAAPS